MLISAIGLGWLAVPGRDAHWVVLDAGGYRGVYTSSYVGLVTALTSALWLTFVGFYLVRDAVARDERTGVGQLLAAAPLRSAVYLGGKLLSNVLVLGSMVAVLAATALVLQLLRGESRGIDPVGLLAPYLLLALPMLVLTAAAAILFETTPVLRGGAGNILWFFVWMLGAIGGQSPDAPLGGMGVAQATASMRADLAGRSAGEFGLGLMYVDTPLRTFEWSGLSYSAGFLGGRALVTALAVAPALLPALWFHRFDRPAAGSRTVLSGPEPGTVYRGLPRTAPGSGAAFARLLAGELRVLVQGTPLWWWLVAAILAVASLAAWAGGALFIPALALALGTLSGAPRVFQAVYVVVWYLMINDVPALDVMGALREHGRPLGPSPFLVAGLALAGIGVASGVTAGRHRSR